MRKLMRIGFETYVGGLYKQGQDHFAEGRTAAANESNREVIDLFQDLGVKGNLETSDVPASLQRFEKS